MYAMFFLIVENSTIISLPPASRINLLTLFIKMQSKKLINLRYFYKIDIINFINTTNNKRIIV